MNHTSCKDTEIQFGRDDSPSETIVTAFSDTGQITFTVQNSEQPWNACDNELSLGQAIHLRDFLNRHIDGLALAATGSLAVRSSDDPTQLAATETIELPGCVSKRHADRLAQRNLGLEIEGIPHYGAGGEHLGNVYQAQAVKVDAPAGILHLVWNEHKSECVGFYEAEDAAFASTGRHGAVCSSLADTFRELYAEDGGPLPRTTVTFYE